MKISPLLIEDCIDLRHSVLWPDLPRDASRVEGDETARHFGIVSDDVVVSCLSVFEAGEGRVQIRKFATLQAYQGQGMGSFLLQEVLSKLQKEDVQVVFLDAREKAAPFYRRAGFETRGTPFARKGMVFVRMLKQLK